MNRQELWARARNAAGFSEAQAVWMELPGTPDPQGVLATSAGAGTEIDPKQMELDEAGQAWSREHFGTLRVVTYSGVSDAAALGLMRWATEYHRLDRDHHDALVLIRVTHNAHQDRIRASGQGGGRYHHAAPEERQSQAAAAALVTTVFGPQFGELRGVFGPLFREVPPQPEDVFGRRAVAFAAFHRAELENLLREKRIELEDLLRNVDPDAPRWWETLVNDEMFTTLSAAAVYVIPTADETTAAGPTARELWRTAVDLYERAERRALVLLELLP